MDVRDDKLIAIAGLLCASLITILVLFTMVWFMDVRQAAMQPQNENSCMSDHALVQ